MAESTRISAEESTFLRSFQTLLKSAQLYTLAHPRASAAFTKCLADLRPVVREAALTVSVADGRLLLNAQPVEEGLTSRALVHFLSQHNLMSLTFEPDPRESDFRALIEALSVPVVQGQEGAQHIEAKLRDSGVQSIKLNAIRYVATTATGERQSEEVRLVGTLLGDVLRPEQAERIGGMLQDPRKTVQLLSAALMAKFQNLGLDINLAGGAGPGLGPGLGPGWGVPRDETGPGGFSGGDQAPGTGSPAGIGSAGSDSGSLGPGAGSRGTPSGAPGTEGSGSGAVAGEESQGSGLGHGRRGGGSSVGDSSSGTGLEGPGVGPGGYGYGGGSSTGGRPGGEPHEAGGGGSAAGPGSGWFPTGSGFGSAPAGGVSSGAREAPIGPAGPTGGGAGGSVAGGPSGGGSGVGVGGGSGYQRWPAGAGGPGSVPGQGPGTGAEGVPPAGSGAPGGPGGAGGSPGATAGGGSSRAATPAGGSADVGPGGGASGQQAGWASPGGPATVGGSGAPPGAYGGTGYGPQGSGGAQRTGGAATGGSQLGTGGKGGAYGGGVVGGMPGLPGGLGTGVWGPLTDPGIAAMLSENEVMEMVRLLMRLGHQVSGTERTAERSIALREAVLGMDVKPAAVLVNLLAQAPAELGERSTAQVLVDLAEKLAIRYAIGQLEGGSQPAEATRKLINRLAQQILELRKAVLSRDLKLREAGISLESYPEELDRKFWLGVSPTTRTRILRSTEAWAIPIKNIRIHLEELLASGKEREARFILQNYSSSLVSPEAEARQRTLAGVSQLMDLVQRMATPDFLKHFRQVLLERLAQETGSATVKPVVFMLAQVEEMAWRRAEYETARDILATLYKFSREPSERGRECATQFEEIIQDKKLSDRLQSVIASHSPDIRRAVHVFSLLPEKIIQLAMELAERESNPLRRQTISELIGGLGTAATPVLRRMLLSDRKRTVMTALEWLERGHPESILQALPQMVPKQDPQVQYAAITAVIHRDVAGRVRILLDILPHLHRYVQPRVIDELGMLREHDAIGLLIEYATGAKFPDEPYLRVKAIEALGRIGAEQAVEPLVRILSERSFMSSKHPAELRICAAEALERIGGEKARRAIAQFVKGGAAAELKSLPLTEESSWVERRGGRPRKYRRMNLDVKLTAVLHSTESRVTATVRNAGLGGAFFESNDRFPVGTVVTVLLGSGLRPIHAIGMVRSVRPSGLGVEFVLMDLKERERWRRFLRERAAAR